MNDTDDKPYVLSYIRNNLDTTDAVVTVYDTICAIKELPNNKSPDRLYVLMAIVLQSMMKHGFLPQQFMTTMLVPILKNKNGDIASKSNYRPIALSTVASKILEIILVNHVEEYIVTTENQFAYKKGHSTDMCIFTLKECIRYYTVHNTPMYVCFLDASKAFDCINHWKLLKILVDRKCPAYVIKVLVYWYQEQRLCVKWDGMASDTFSVCNGIKQGGILSPKLFNIYVDVLSQQLNKVMVECCMNGKVFNHLYYADDLVLLSPSTHGMQKLLNECETYASKYEMKFNENKSVVLNFKGHRFKANPSAKLYLNGSLMKTAVSYTYLGHIINNNLNDNKDIERQLRNFYGKSNMLLRTFGSCSYAVKLQLFMAYCGSMYTAFLLCDFTQRKYRHLEVAYNNVFRRFLGYDKYCSASSMFVENRTDGFDARIRKLVYDFRERLQISENSLIVNYHKQFSVAFLKIVKFVGEVLIFAINHDFKCTNAVIKTMLCFSYILFTIFCDVVYYVSILFCPGFNC